MLAPELKQRYTESLIELQRVTARLSQIYDEIESAATADELIEMVLKELPADER